MVDSYAAKYCILSFSEQMDANDSTQVVLLFALDANRNVMVKMSPLTRSYLSRLNWVSSNCLCRFQRQKAFAIFSLLLNFRCWSAVEFVYLALGGSATMHQAIRSALER